MAKAKPPQFNIKSLCENLENAISEFDNTVAEKPEKKKMLEAKKPEIEKTFKKLKTLLEELS
ncbi:MAG: hypothetical protein HOO06_12070 [Bdellovibrionaceae bacterium]|jgi:hypothetical protein|nr:hypothetical protein [Pseudobdellovibrionaceae bacterium]